jgi:hypothetical protein
VLLCRCAPLSSLRSSLRTSYCASSLCSSLLVAALLLLNYRRCAPRIIVSYIVLHVRCAHYVVLLYYVATLLLRASHCALLFATLIYVCSSLRSYSIVFISALLAALISLRSIRSARLIATRIRFTHTCSYSRASNTMSCLRTPITTFALLTPYRCALRIVFVRSSSRCAHLVTLHQVRSHYRCAQVIAYLSRTYLAALAVLNCIRCAHEFMTDTRSCGASLRVLFLRAKLCKKYPAVGPKGPCFVEKISRCKRVTALKGPIFV